jgi:hypothetical protein
MQFKRFRKRRKGPDPRPYEATAEPDPQESRQAAEQYIPDSDGMVTLPGTGWTGDLWREAPVRVPWTVDVKEFLGRRPLPYLWPNDTEYRAHIDAHERPEQLLRAGWVDAFLHHPDEQVVIQCLRDAFTGDNVWNLTTVADILGCAAAPEVKQEAAKAVWRVSDTGVHWVFNVLLSRGLIPSDYDALSVHQALGHLRATCPPERVEMLESELSGPDRD